MSDKPKSKGWPLSQRGAAIEDETAQREAMFRLQAESVRIKNEAMYARLQAQAAKENS